jgi:hypothetical protein
MKIHTITTQANGIISVVLQPTFVGDQTDSNDKALIAAYGDPQINIAGTFTDPNNPSFVFQFPVSENFVGLTTQLSSQVAQFMLALPTTVNPNQYVQAPVQGPMACITPNPSQAATVWQSVVVSKIASALMALRSKTLVPSIPDITV